MTRGIIILLFFISIDWILYVADMVPRKQTMSYKAACRMFFGSVPRINTFSKGSRTGQGEKLGCDAVTPKATANPMGNSRAEVALYSSPKLRQGDQYF